MMLNSGILLYRLKRRLARFAGRQISDDFDWDSYNLHYRGELAGIAKEHTLTLREGDYSFADGALTQSRPGILPLHANHRLLYETILQLQPSSIFELGCGGGDHLANLRLFLPHVKLHGIDISRQQLGLLQERHPELRASTVEFDAKTPFPDNFPQTDIAFTQAVLMHIQTGDGHLVALSNLFRTATKQVVLMENWTRHPFVDDIRRLHDLGQIPWQEIHFHYRDSPEFRKPHLLIMSQAPLPQYKSLTDFAVLRDAVSQPIA